MPGEHVPTSVGRLAMPEGPAPAVFRRQGGAAGRQPRVCGWDAGTPVCGCCCAGKGRIVGDVDGATKLASLLKAS